MFATPCAPSAIPAMRYQIRSDSLLTGMYVAELDRPWLDTPFLLQGFRIDSPIELETLRRYCRYVHVDATLSDAGLAETIRGAALRGDPFDAPDEPVPVAPLRFDTVLDERAPPPARPGRPVRLRSDLAISRQTRQRFRNFIRATALAAGDRSGPSPPLGRRLLEWLGRSGGRGGYGRNAGDEAGDSLARARHALARQLAPDARLRRYADRATIEDELPRARIALAHSMAALPGIAASVRDGVPPRLDELLRAVDELVESMIDNPDAAMWIASGLDDGGGAGWHGLRVALNLIAFGRHLGLPRRELAHLGTIGMLADVGKNRLPRALLEKPGMLTAAEYNVVKEHVRLGLEALRGDAGLPAPVGDAIAQHHERLDGSGYPKGLKGDEIGAYGRMAAIADSFAALVAARAYANPSAPPEALMSLFEWGGTSFDDALVEQFVHAIGLFPVGSLVELSSGELAVVIAHNRAHRLEPRVLVLAGADKAALAAPFEIDLQSQRRERNREPLRIARGLADGAYGLGTAELVAQALPTRRGPA